MAELETPQVDLETPWLQVDPPGLIGARLRPLGGGGRHSLRLLKLLGVRCARAEKTKTNAVGLGRLARGRRARGPEVGPASEAFPLVKALMQPIKRDIRILTHN